MFSNCLNRKSQFTFALIYLFVTSLATPAAAAEQFKFPLPHISGLKVTAGDTFVIPGASNSIAFRFRDGRIVVVGKDHGVWSIDGGRTWTKGPRGPMSKTVIDLGSGEILMFGSSSSARDDGRYELPVVRSIDNWQTQTDELALFNIPRATFCGGDDGARHSGMIAHHGVLQLKNDDLMITMYGNYQGDNELADAYPVEFNMRKYRTIVVFSSDRGKTWGHPVTVAYKRMLARGLDSDSSVISYRDVPAVTQEGFCEPDLTRAPNGDIICMMRSGGRIGVGNVPIFPTPMYASRSSDEGKTWTTPVQVADRGVCPYLVTLDNGIIVCSYARPGNWLIFSDDNGQTWKGEFMINTRDSYCKVLAVAPDKILTIYHADGKIKGTFFTVQKNTQ